MNPIITEMQSKDTVRAYVEGNKDVFEFGQNETVAICKLLLRLQGYPARTWNGPFLLACLAWGSLFAETWMLLTRSIVNDGIAWGMWLFFLMTGVFSSSMAMRK